MIVLGIETSCDETSAAIIRDWIVLSNKVYSQEVHKIYGGVVPELASIDHEKNIYHITKEALESAEINLKQGKWLTMVAKEGIFNIEKQTLELIGNVLFLHSDGQQIDTNNAVIDLKKAKIYGNKKIFGKNESINFSSEGFEFKQKRKKFSLFGKSKIKIKSTKN